MTISPIQTASSLSPPLSTQKSGSVASDSANAATDAQSTAATASAASANQTTTNTDGVDSQELANAVDKVQTVTQTLANELAFSIDQDSGRTVVKIIDSSTDEVIRQIPSEEMLAIADALDQIQGMLLKQKA